MKKGSFFTVNHRLQHNLPMWVLIFMVQILIISASFMGGFFFHELQFSDVSILQNVSILKKEFSLLSEAHHLLVENALIPLPEEKTLEYGMIRGMLQAYNEPYTIFVEPPQHELQTNQLQGKFGGIGVRIERDAENYIYLYPLPGSSAMGAGVQEADRLLKVEDIEITPQTSNDEVQAAIRGPIGEKLSITVGRSPDFIPIELSIERAEVALPSVTWNLVPDVSQVGVLQVHVIASTTPDEIANAINDLQQRGATRFIVDLRNNGGGLVEAGVDTARLFLSDGYVIKQQYRGEEAKTFKVEKTGPFTDLPIVLLVNHGTASAAEILAGALQGQKRAIVVGTRTYGKDSIQLVFDLSDGSSLHVTSARWWVPGLSQDIGEKGLQPDVLIDEGLDMNIAMQKAVETVLVLK